MFSRRIERIAELLHQEISKIILYELKDPRIKFITVVKVEVSPDLKKAKVYVSIMGDTSVQRKNLQGLEHAKGFIQSEVGARLQTKYTPILTFCLDESIKKSQKISDLIDQAVKGTNVTNER